MCLIGINGSSLFGDLSVAAAMYHAPSAAGNRRNDWLPKVSSSESTACFLRRDRGALFQVW